MSHPVALLCVFALVLVWAGVFLIFRVLRQKRLQTYKQRSEFWAKAPPWLRAVEGSVSIIAWVLIGSLLTVGLLRLHHALHPRASEPGEAAVALLVVSAMLAGLPFALLLSNCVSWILPFTRRANETASEGLPRMSFTSANRELLIAAAVMTPIALAQALLGAFEPWAH